MKKDFDVIKDMVIKMLDRFNISQDDTHIGLLEFSDTTTVEIPLNTSYEKGPLISLIDRVIPSSGKTVELDKTLRQAADSFRVENGGRAGVPKVLIVIIGSKDSSEEDLKEAVSPLKETGVQVFVYSIGNETDPEGLGITPPKNTGEVDTPDELLNKTNELGDKITKEVDKGNVQEVSV